MVVFCIAYPCHTVTAGIDHDAAYFLEQFNFICGMSHKAQCTCQDIHPAPSWHGPALPAAFQALSGEPRVHGQA